MLLLCRIFLFGFVTFGVVIQYDLAVYVVIVVERGGAVFVYFDDGPADHVVVIVGAVARFQTVGEGDPFVVYPRAVRVIVTDHNQFGAAQFLEL